MQGQQDACKQKITVSQGTAHAEAAGSGPEQVEKEESSRDRSQER